MDKVKVKGWRVIDTEGSSLTYVPPEYHPTYWEIPKWYYKGRYVYTSCIRIDVDGTTSIFIDGMTPLMEITVIYDGTTTLKTLDLYTEQGLTRQQTMLL